MQKEGMACQNIYFFNILSKICKMFFPVLAWLCTIQYLEQIPQIVQANLNLKEMKDITYLILNDCKIDKRTFKQNKCSGSYTQMHKKVLYFQRINYERTVYDKEINRFFPLCSVEVLL